VAFRHMLSYYHNRVVEARERQMSKWKKADWNRYYDERFGRLEKTVASLEEKTARLEVTVYGKRVTEGTKVIWYNQDGSVDHEQFL
jgi:hypothetical protein